MAKRKPSPPLVAISKEPGKFPPASDVELLRDYILAVPQILVRADGDELARSARKLLPEVEEFVCSLRGELASKVWALVRLVLLVEGAGTNTLYAAAATAGGGTSRGGKKGAAVTNPQWDTSPDDWREEFAKRRQKNPSATKQHLLTQLSDDLGPSVRTLRRAIKDK